MKGILLLILIVPLLGILALGGEIASNPPQIQQPTRAQADGSICVGAFVIFSLLGLFALPGMGGSTSNSSSGIGQPLPIERTPRTWEWERHKETEWECEDDGTVIAYRYLQWVGDEFSSGTMGLLRHNKVLNRPAASWRGAMNFSDRVPTMNNKSGIYAAKTPDSPILYPYRDPDTALVKLRLSGRIIEAEYGYRAQKAEIIEILEHVPPEA